VEKELAKISDEYDVIALAHSQYEPTMEWVSENLNGQLRIGFSTPELRDYFKIVGQPISIVASNSKKFNSNWEYFRQPIRRWLISSSKVDNSSNNKFEKELFFEDSWGKTLISLKKLGINDLALLGGAKLINSFIKEDLITDIKITIIPRIIGGRYTWIPPEETNAIFNLKRLWEIKSIKNLMNNEIHVHYKKI